MAYLRYLQMHWQDVAAALGVFFGIVSLIAYWEQRRTTKSQAVFLEFLKRQVQQEVSKETIEKLSAQLQEMQRQTTEDIPKLARKAVLQEQAEMLRNNLVDTYSRWRQVEEELQADLQHAIDPAITQTIVDRLLPVHELRRRTEYLRDRASILAAALVLSGIVLPYPMDRFIAYLISFYLALAVFQYSALRFRSPSHKRTLRNLARLVLALVFLSLLGFGVLLLSEGRRNVTEFGVALGYGSVGLGVLGFGTFRLLDKRIGAWLEKQASLASATDVPGV